MTVLMGPWEGTPIPPDEWRRLYLVYPNVDIRRAIESVCPGALDGLDDVKEAGVADILAGLRELYAVHPSEPIAQMIENVERRLAEGET